MTDEDFNRRLKEAYREEASELLTEVQKKLLALTDAGTTYGDQLPHISRSLSLLHSFKGAARAVSESQAVTICQWLETALSNHKKDNRAIEPTDLHKLTLSLELLDELVVLADDNLSGKEKIKAEVKKILAAILESDDINMEVAVSQDANSYDIFGRAEDQKVDVKKEPMPPKNDVSATKSTPQEIQAAPSPVVIDNLTSVRVPFEKLDRLLSESEELITVKTKAGEQLQQLQQLKSLVTHLTDEVSLLSSPQERRALLSLAQQVQSKVTGMARGAARDGNTTALTINRYLESAKTLVMLPVASCFEVFPRLIRELNRELDKDVHLIIEGGELEIDRRILERLKDPLVHLLRNAMDHAIESTTERHAAGKRQAQLTVSARQLNGETIEIVIVDNGRGIDEEAVRRSAIKKQLLTEKEAVALSIDEVYALIFRPDFSTRETVNELSGRGLGLAIVKEKIEELNGRIELTSSGGVGTSFRIIVPTTLATFMGVLVEAAGQRFVVPLAGLNRAIRVHPLALEIVDERETFIVDGQVLPVASLAKALNLPAAPIHSTHSQSRGFKYLEMLVLSYRDKKAGLIVDQILIEQEFLVKKLGYPLGQLNNFAGATILADGKVALVLNISDLVETIVNTRFMQDQKLASGLAAMLDREDENNSKQSVLIVDDSVTARVFMRSIVEAAGYRVTLAVDGQDALNKLKLDTFDLVLTDVEMPLLNGFELLKAIRASDALKELPVVLITSLAGKEHREEGMAAGADDFIVKGDEQQSSILEVIKKLI